MGWGGSSGSYTTLNEETATAGIYQTDYDVRTNTIPGGWDGSMPISSTYSVTHDFYFSNVTSDIGPVTLSSNSSTITMPDLTTQALYPADHNGRAFAERYGLTTHADDGWPYIVSFQWEIYNPVGGNITSGYGHTFNNGAIVLHPVGNGNTYDANFTWSVNCGASWNGGVFAAGSYAYLRRTVQIYRSGGSTIDITTNYTGSGITGGDGSPDVRLQLKSGQDGVAGNGPYFGTDVAITGEFDISTSGIPVPVGAGRPTTIITS